MNAIKITDLLKKRAATNTINDIFEKDKNDDESIINYVCSKNPFFENWFIKACVWHKFSPESIEKAKKCLPFDITEIKNQFDRIEILQRFPDDTIELISKLNWKLVEEFSCLEPNRFTSETISMFDKQIIPRNLVSKFVNRESPIELIKNQNLKFIFNELFPEAKWDTETPITLARKLHLQSGFDMQILFMYQDLPNLTSAFLLDNKKLNTDIFSRWLNNICPFQTIPIELLDEPFFSFWIKKKRFFSRAFFPESFLEKFAKITDEKQIALLAAIKEKLAVDLENLTGEDEIIHISELRQIQNELDVFRRQLNKHWYNIFSDQTISEDFALRNRHRPHFYRCTPNVKFSPKIIRLWKQIDLEQLFKSTIPLSQDLIRRMFSPKYDENDIETYNEYLKNKLSDEMDLWGDDRWDKTNGGFWPSPSLTSLFNNAFVQFQGIIPPWELGVLMGARSNLIEFSLLTNSVQNGMFTPTICKNNPNIVEYAIKHCSLSDDVINEIYVGCELSLNNFIPREKTNLTKNDKYASWLIKYQILPSHLITELLQLDIQVRRLIKHQRFTNEQIQIVLSTDDKINKYLPNLWFDHDFSRAGRDFLFDNYLKYFINDIPRRFLLSNAQLSKMEISDKRVSGIWRKSWQNNKLVNIVKFGKLSDINKESDQNDLLTTALVWREKGKYVPLSVVKSSADSLKLNELHFVWSLLTTTKLDEEEVFNLIINYFKIDYEYGIEVDYQTLIDWEWIFLIQNFTQLNYLEKLKNIIPWKLFFEYSKNVTVEVVKRFCNPQEYHTFAIIRNNQISKETKDEIIAAFPELSWPKIGIESSYLSTIVFDDHEDVFEEVNDIEDNSFESTEDDDEDTNLDEDDDEDEDDEDENANSTEDDEDENANSTEDIHQNTNSTEDTDEDEDENATDNTRSNFLRRFSRT